MSIRTLHLIKRTAVAGLLLFGGWLLPAAAHAQEVPRGTVAFFTGTACPAGWAPPTYAQGRLIVATVTPSAVGTLRGRPLSNLEDRKHKHHYATQINIDHKSICGACSCCSGQGANSGAYSVSADMAESTTGLPFVQYLVCEKA